MSTMQNLILNSEETVLWTGKPEPSPILAVGMLWFTFACSFIASMSWMYLSLSQSALLTIYSVIGMASIVHFWFAATRTRYVVTDERLFVYDGGIRPVTAALEKNQVAKIDVQEGIVESALNSGRIVLKTKDGRTLALSSLTTPKDLALTLSQYMPNAEINTEPDTSSQVTGVTWSRSFSDN